MSWQPIETAPRDGTWFRCKSAHQVRTVHFADYYDRLPISDDQAVWTTIPTHWHPLSESPEATK